MGAPVQAQQAKQVARPAEQIVIRPARMSWDELLQVQASLPSLQDAQWSLQPTIEPQNIELSKVERRFKNGLLAEGAEHTDAGGIAKSTASCVGFGAIPAVGASFDSQLDVPDGNSFVYIPPDVAGAVGPEHLMTMLANKVLIQDRLGGAVSNVDTQVFWSVLGTTPLAPTTTYQRVYFDALAGRWLASARNGVGSLGTTVLFFAISDTDDPTGSWDFYSIVADGTATTQADWVTMGFNSTWIVLHANMFNLAGTVFSGAKAWVMDKSTALSGGPVTVSIFGTGYPTALTGGIAGSASFIPAQTYDATPSLYMYSNSFSSGGTNILQCFEVTGTGPSPSISGIPGTGIVAATSGMFFVTTTYSTATAGQKQMQQVGDPRLISVFSVRVSSVAVRNGKMWLTHSAATPGPASNAATTNQISAWYEVDPALMPTPIVQSGQILDPVALSAVAYPSIAVNCAEDVLMSFAQGNSTIDPQASYVMRLAGDALNTMSAITVLKAGEGWYWKGAGNAAYGRYSTSHVDPLDDKTLWTIQEFADARVGAADADSRWGTTWGRLGDCEKKPDITLHPTSAQVCVGDMVTFTVAATSSLPITYQWRKDNVSIPGATTTSYVIASAVGGDLGVYDCVVCSCGQRISNPASLTFNGATFPTQPTTINAALYTPASFTVVASGTGTLFYQWNHDGNPISGATASTYNIASVVAADYGDYDCEVTDDCGPVTSDTAQLLPPVDFSKVKPGTLSLHIFSQPEDTIGCIGSPMTLDIVAEPPGISYQWSKNGIAIGGATNSVYTIPSFAVADGGNYRCTVSIGVKSKTSDVAVVSVGDDPVVTLHPLPVQKTASVGDYASYTVAGTGAGTIHYQWRKKSNAQGASFTNIPGAVFATLNLGQITLTDAGQYRCVLSNLCGATVTNIATLTVVP